MRLIDADTIKIPSTSVDAFENCGNCKLLDEYQVKEIIDNAPTVDAEQIRHGEWIPLWFDEEDRLFGELPTDYKCSACNLIISRKFHQDYGFRFCPNCGAKMDGGKDDET